MGRHASRCTYSSCQHAGDQDGKHRKGSPQVLDKDLVVGTV